MEGYREEGDPRGEEAFDVGEEAAGAESLLAAEDLPAEETLDAGAEAAGEAGEEGGVADPAPGGEPAPPAGGEMAGGGLTQVVYEVKDGDSLWKVAENLLGAGHRYREIVAWNPEVLAASEVLHAGARLKLFVPSPPESLKAPDAPADIAVEEGSPPAEPELETPSGEEPSASPKPAQVVLHRVKENENLRKIAKHYLPAEPQGWRRIFVANEDRLVSPDKIKQGQLLKIPLKDPAGGIGN
jgi:nucleoid-associated protein YgaU